MGRTERGRVSRWHRPETDAQRLTKSERGSRRQWSSYDPPTQRADYESVSRESVHQTCKCTPLLTNEGRTRIGAVTRWARYDCLCRGSDVRQYLSCFR